MDVALVDVALAACYLVAAVAAGVVGVTAWRRRSGTPAAIGLVVAMAGLVWWALADTGLVIASVSGDPGLGRSLVAWLLPGVSVTVLGFLLLCVWVADRSWRPSRGVVLLLGTEPVLVVLAAVADPWWHLLVAEWHQGSGVRRVWTPAAAFWVHALYCYAVMAWSALRLLRSARHAPPVYRRQVASLLGAGLVPTVASAITVFTPLGRSLPDLTAIAFVVTGVADGYALFRQGLLTVVPVARGLVLDSLTDAVMVVDPQGRVLDVNAEGQALARRLAAGLPADLAGIPARRLLGGRDIPLPMGTGEYRTEIDGVPVVLDVRVDDLDDRRGHRLATVVVIRDVTAVHRQRDELAAANARLCRQHAELSEVNRRLEQQVGTIDALRAELAEQAVRDELTGLHNRRHLVAALSRGLRAAERRGADFCVVLLDLDHFKSVNDTYGHDVGDAVLRATGTALAGTLRDVDTLARYGGEEFVVLLPDTTIEQAAVRARELRLRCAEVVVASRLGAVSTTVSLGVASVRHLARPTAKALLKAADEALYRAKELGRDRVVLATELTGTPSQS